MLDLAAAESFDDQVSVFRGQGDGTFTRLTTLETGKFPIFVLTAVPRNQPRDWDGRVEGVLEKPVSVRHLLARLADYFHRERTVS